jgi:hypothetical protein
MKRALVFSGMLLSLLLLIASAALTVRTYMVADTLFWGAGRVGRGVMTTNGRILIWENHRVGADDRPVQFAFSHRTHKPTDFGRYWSGGAQSAWNRAGFGYWSQQIRDVQSTTLVFPTWLLCLVFAAGPVVWTKVSWARRQRRLEEGDDDEYEDE